MFKIELQDVGVDDESKVVTTYLDTLSEVLDLANDEVMNILGHTDFVIHKITNCVYVITHYNIFTGAFIIRRC